MSRVVAKGMLMLLTALVLAGCVSYAGITHQDKTRALPGEVVTEHFGDWPAPRWWERYREPALNELINHALAESPTLKVVEARLRAVQAGVDFANARRLPQVDASASSKFQRYSEHGAVGPDLAGDFRSEDRLALDLQYELDFFGRQKALAEAAGAEAQATRYDGAAARLALVTAITRGWFSLAEALAERRVVGDTLTQRQQIRKLVEVREQEGLDSRVEVQQAEGGIAEARTELATLDERIELLRALLARLAIVPLASTAGLSPHFDPHALAPLPLEIPSDLLARRPDIAAARLRVESLLKGVESVQAEFYPTVNLNAFAGLSSIGLESLFTSGALVAGILPSVRLPVFDAGRLRAKLRFVNAQLDMTIERYNDTLTEALREVTRALISRRALGPQLTARHAAQAAAESASALALERYRAGLTGYLTVLTTETEVLRQRRAAVMLSGRNYDLDIDLQRALGGGFNEAASAPLTAGDSP